MIRRARRDGREARGNEEKGVGLRKGAEKRVRNKTSSEYSHLSDAGKDKEYLFMKFTKGISFSHKSLMATPTQRM